jgi:hypothetical protein
MDQVTCLVFENGRWVRDGCVLRIYTGLCLLGVVFLERLVFRFSVLQTLGCQFAFRKDYEDRPQHELPRNMPLLICPAKNYTSRPYVFTRRVA